MKNNIIPSIIIAIAILIAALAPRQTGASQVKLFLQSLEDASKEKDADGKSQIERIASGFTKATTQGIKSGFGGDDPQVDKGMLSIIGKLEIRDVKIVKSQFKSKERVIGIFKNSSDKIVKDIQLNVVFKAADGALMDVSDSFARVSGPVKPSDEIGFEIDRTIGDFNAKDDELEQNRASSAIVKIQTLKVID